MAQALPMDRTAEFRPGLNLIVENGNWGATSLTAVRAVLASAADVLLKAFGISPDAPVCVARWDQDPRVFYDMRPYEIRISARDTHWCQYAYQFSHELCHVMTGFDRFKEHRHNWFEESLCELASLFVLHRLAEVWAEEPPLHVHVASEFAPNHATYAEGIEESYRLPLDGTSLEFLTENIETLEADPFRRDLNGAVAVALLDYFLRDPTLWRDCLSLNQWNPSADSTLSDYLESWTACLRERGSDARAPALVREIFRLNLVASRAARGRATAG